MHIISIRILFSFMMIISFIRPSHAQTIDASETSEGILITENGKKVLFYQKATNTLNGQYPRSHYIHPLYGLDEDVLTEDFPEDHFHHRGIYWAWVQVWKGDHRLGDSWHTRDVQIHAKDASWKINEDGSLMLNATAHWYSPNYKNDKIPFLKDELILTVLPEKKHLRVINIEISLTPLAEDIRLGGSENSKGYSGFSARLLLPDKVTFTSDMGIVKPDVNAVKAGHWMNIEGRFSDSTKGITIIAHKDNPPPVDQWILRSENSMQNAVYPGRKPVQLDTDNPLKLRYRLIIHDGSLTEADIKNQYADF